jgi:NADPH-dependent glutamate synthase beta subunit-like oxidoreductase
MVAGRTHIPVVEAGRCNACLTCIRACPVWVLGIPGPEEDSLRAAVARRILFPDLPGDAKFFEAQPCAAACPLGQDVPGYLGAVAAGDVERAMEIILRTNPLPSVLGRICLRPCTKACIRGRLEEAPDIRGLKHHAAAACGEPKEKSLAPGARTGAAGRAVIVGSGPAGLAAASVLARGGWRVTVIEKNAEPGGMLRYAVAPFDLPVEDLERDVRRIRAEGVEIRTGIKIESLGALAGERADAVLVATGAAGPGGAFEHTMAGIEGVRDVVSFARDVRERKIAKLRGGVVVEGFGLPAVTTARMAARLGAEVSLVVPASLEESELGQEGFAAAKADGIRIVAPARVMEIRRRGKRIRDVVCAPLSFGRRDPRGRPLDERQGKPFILAADLLVHAMDRKPDCPWVFGGGVEEGIGGIIRVDPATLMTGRKGIFAAGDAATGPRSVISAVAMGVKAARAIMGQAGR